MNLSFQDAIFFQGLWLLVLGMVPPGVLKHMVVTSQFVMEI